MLSFIILSDDFCYDIPGLELTFFSGVYGTCITHTGAFGSDANSLIGWSGMIIGGGEILGKFDSEKRLFSIKVLL